jgi:pilus assembly protein CpaC
MSSWRPNSTLTTIVGMLLLTVTVFTANAGAQKISVQTGIQPQKLKLISGKSIIIRCEKPVKRVSIAAPEVADFLMLSPRQIYLTGKDAGTTNLTLWNNGDIAAVFDLETTYDVSSFKEQLHIMLPEEEGIRVIASRNSLTLAGKVATNSNLLQTLALAKAYAPEGKINNLLEVGGVHQVMLEVRIAEISRSTTKQLGVNWTYINGDDFGVGMLGGLTELVNPQDANIASGGPFGLNTSSAVNALFRWQTGGVTWTAFIDALEEDGLAKVLAEPTLVALSGQSATFLAGGEYPVPVPQGLGTVAIEYKPFGVGLTFTPVVRDKNHISMKVEPDISELDFSTAAHFSGYVIPGLTTRRASTTIELAEGQSFAIAGLLRENIRDSIQKYPFLGDIPVLGALFRSKSFQKNETELLIVVTPKLIKPLDMRKQTLPTDSYIEPSDLEYYFLTGLEGRKKHSEPEVSGQMEGNVGHSDPAGDNQ